MSKKHNDQKLIIENFNKWINEEEENEEPAVEEAAGSCPEDEPIEEGELQEIVVASGVAYATGKFLTGLSRLLGAYNDLTRITDEMMQDPNTPEALKDVASGVAQAGADIKDEAGTVARDLPVGQKLTQAAIAKILKKHFGIKVDPESDWVPNTLKPEPEEPPIPEPEPQPHVRGYADAPESEPEDMESRAKLGLMSKEKEDRLSQLRTKYKTGADEDDDDVK
jgi:hypothetical protein